MKGMRSGILPMAMMMAAMLATSAPAQSALVDLAVTYDALHTNHTTAQDIWMQGGAIELGARVYHGPGIAHGLGIAARVEGLHAGTNSTTSEPLSLVTTVFGPRYTMETRSHRYAIFGEGLVGISNGFYSGSANAGTTSSSNALAVDVGGGLDVRLNHRFAVRAVRASYLRTQFPNSTTNVQNSLSLSAGLVVHFGK